MMKIFVGLLIGISSYAFGQNIIQPFELVNVMDGKTTAVKNCNSCAGMVVIFTSLKCPYDHHYQDRIKALLERYGSKISFYLVNSNPGADEDEPKMKAAMNSWGYNLPYLSDKKQITMKTLGATRTPEAVLLKPEGTGFKILYQGAIDDNPQVHHDTGKDFLHDAISEFLAGKSVAVSSERVIGCTIRKAN